MRRRTGATLLVLVSALLLLAGCGEAGDDERASTIPCDDAAFRLQDEELYVSLATIANALGGGGDAAQLVLDLRRARTVLQRYLDAHPPCDQVLTEVERLEREAIAALGAAIGILDDGGDAVAELTRAREALESAQSTLSDGS